MTTTVNVHTAKTELSKLLARVEKGEEIVIARGTVPVARLVPIAPETKKRVPGRFKGKISIGPEFFEPLPQDELDAWEQ